MTYHPDTDGITHINVYSKGRTELGRRLSNFSYSPFIHPVHGPFVSMEGYWYWIKTGRRHEFLRALYGYRAKQEGSQLSVVMSPTFEQDILEGLRCKILQCPYLRSELKASVLPLAHYYVYSGKVVDVSHKHRWQLDGMEQLRAELQEDDDARRMM